jgi:cell division protein FtsB
MTRSGDPRALRTAIALTATILLGNALAGERGLTATVRAHHDQAALTTEIASLKAENTRLRARVRALASDPAAIEIVARRDLGLLKRDEKLVVLAR